MTVGDVVVVLIVLAGFGLWLFWIPRWWRNEPAWSYDPDRPPPAWPYGAALWRSGVRTNALAGPVALLLAVLYALDASSAGWTRAAFLVAAVPFCAVLGLAVTVVLFNRPRWAVVPHMRHQPGLLAEWRGARAEPTERPARRRA